MAGGAVLGLPLPSPVILAGWPAGIEIIALSGVRLQGVKRLKMAGSAFDDQFDRGLLDGRNQSFS
jgi:hypothetical protein